MPSVPVTSWAVARVAAPCCDWTSWPFEPDNHLTDRRQRHVDQAGYGSFDGDGLVEQVKRRDSGHDLDRGVRPGHGRCQVPDLSTGGGYAQRRHNQQLRSTSESNGRGIPDPDHQRQRRLLEQVDQVLDIVAQGSLRIELKDGGLGSVGGSFGDRFLNKTNGALIEGTLNHDDIERGGLLGARDRHDSQDGQQGQEEEKESMHGRNDREGFRFQDSGLRSCPSLQGRGSFARRAKQGRVKRQPDGLAARLDPHPPRFARVLPPFREKSVPMLRGEPLSRTCSAMQHRLRGRRGAAEGGEAERVDNEKRATSN